MQKKILIVSKAPTHPTTAGNRYGIKCQAELLMQLGCEVFFLFIYEQPLLKENKALKHSKDSMKEYWGDNLFIYEISIFQKLLINLKVYTHKLVMNFYTKCDDYYPLGFSHYVRKLQKKYNFDTCIINYFYLTKLFNHVNFSQKALFTHDNYAYKDIAIGTRADIAIDANQSAKAMQRSPHIFAVQDEEAVFFKLLSPNSRVYTIYSYYSYQPTQYVGNKKILFFSGPNIYNKNGLKWFLDCIFPLIIEEFPDAELLIGGGICNELPHLKQRNHIRLIGPCPSPIDFYKLGDVAINPVYQGTGIKIKTFEAVSCGKVTMVHPHSIRGIFKSNDSPFFYSDNAREWVNYLKEIWSSAEKINYIKNKDEEYIKLMRSHIEEQYKLFLKD